MPAKKLLGKEHAHAMQLVAKALDLYGHPNMGELVRRAEAERNRLQIECLVAVEGIKAITQWVEQWGKELSPEARQSLSDRLLVLITASITEHSELND